MTQTQKPSPGRIVIVAGIEATTNNGATEAPGIITRVWSDDLVNVRIFTDADNMIQSRTSVPLYATDKEYGKVAGEKPLGCYWPPRV